MVSSVSCSPTSADRPMFGGQIVRQRLLMDESTIDCCKCSASGTLEVALYRLASAQETGLLEWECIGRRVLCDDHQELLIGAAQALKHHHRMILMSL